MPGGKGATQAVACMRLSRMSPESYRNGYGYRRSSRTERDVNIVVDLIGVVGDDPAGGIIIDTLRREGLSTERIRKLYNTTTGTANVTVDATGENHVVLYNGANHEFDDNDISFPDPTPNLVILQLEIRKETVIDLIAEAKRRGSSVLLNAAPAVQLPAETYRQIDHLIMNQIEADTLIDPESVRDRGLDDHENDNVRRADIIKKYQIYCESFLEKGVRNVVITLRGLGGVAATRATNGTNIVVDYKADVIDNIVDETGCGAVFIGAYAVEIQRQKANSESFDISRAVRWASKAAGLSSQKLGSMDGIPWADKLDKA